MATVSTVRPQPIAGVSSGAENEIMTVYPSVSATGLGRVLGRLYESIPLGRSPVKLSYLLFTLPTAPIPLTIYALQKIAGVRYVLTNREVRAWKMVFGSQRRLLGRVLLDEIDEIVVRRRPGQKFYRAADLELIGKAGNRLLRLDAIPWAELFRETILEARDAYRRVKESLETIQQRHTA